MTAREELEAFIWRAMAAYRVDAYTPVPFVDAVLRAADRYATAEGGITAERRAALAPPPAPRPVHYDGGGARSCGGRLRNETATELTADPGQVTCRRCKQSRAWKEAAA